MITDENSFSSSRDSGKGNAGQYLPWQGPYRRSAPPALAFVPPDNSTMTSMRSLVSLGLRLGSAVCVLTALLGAPAIGATVVRTMVYHQLTTFTNGVQGTTRPLMLSANGQKMVFPRVVWLAPQQSRLHRQF